MNSGFLIVISDITSLEDVITVMDTCHKIFDRRNLTVMTNCHIKKGNVSDVYFLCFEPCVSPDQYASLRYSVTNDIRQINDAYRARRISKITDDNRKQWQSWADANGPWTIWAAES